MHVHLRFFVRLAVYTVLLFASWNHNLLGITDGIFYSRTDVRSGCLGSESHLVVCRLVHANEVPACYPLAGPTPDGGFIPYPSQVGLSGIVLASIHNVTGVKGARFAESAAIGFTLLTALVMASILAAAQYWLGPPTGDVACALSASTGVFLMFAPSLYWNTWLLLAPFAIVWCFYPKATTLKRKTLLLAGVGVAVLAKSLCGYEYITAVISAPVAAAWFHQHRLGEPIWRRVKAAVTLVGVGLLGFAAAMCLHVLQQSEVLGQDGIEVIRNRAMARTVSDPQAEAALATPGSNPVSRFDFAAKRFFQYFDQRAISITAGFGRIQKDMSLGLVALLSLVFVLAVGVIRRRVPREAAALAGALALGFLASVSWQLLATNHMCVHLHLNRIVFCVPFLPLAYLAAGFTVRLLLGEKLGRWFGTLLLIAIVAIMLVNLRSESQGWRQDEAEQAAAEAAVAEDLGQAIDPPGGGLGGAVDRVQLAANVHDSLLLDYGLFDLNTARPADPGSLVLEGWALGESKTTRRPMTRIVAAIGDTIVPMEVLRFRRSDIELLVGKALPGSGFVAVIPSAYLKPGERLRVFVVSTAEPHRIAELAVK